jgi:hypothetical protein
MANGMVWLMPWPVKHSHMQIFALQPTTVSNVTHKCLSRYRARAPPASLSLAHQIEKAQRAVMEASLPAGTRASDGILEPSRILLAHRHLYDVVVRVCALCAWGYARARTKRSKQTYYEAKDHYGHRHSRAYAYVNYLHVAGSKSALVCVYTWPMPGRCANKLRSDTSIHLSMAVSSSETRRVSFVPDGQGSLRKVSRTPSASSRTNEEEGGESDQQ